MSAMSASEPARPPAGPAVPVRLVMVRHGQTPANVGRVLDTRLPGPDLTELGREQAAWLAAALADGAEGPIAAVHHSRAVRAQQTAAIVAGALGLEAAPVDGFQEVSAGDLEGRHDDASVDLFRARFAAWQRGDLGARMPGGESGHELLVRLGASIAEICERQRDGGTAVVVGHGASLRMVAAGLLVPGEAPPPEEDHLANCGRFVVEWVPAGLGGDGDGRGGVTGVSGGEGGVGQGGGQVGRSVGRAGSWHLVRWLHEVPGGLPSSRDVTG